MGIRVRKTREWELHAQSLLGLSKQLSIKHWSAPKEKMEKDNLSLVLHSKGDLRLVWQTQLSLITNVYVFERLHSVTESWWCAYLILILLFAGATSHTRAWSWWYDQTLIHNFYWMWKLTLQIHELCFFALCPLTTVLKLASVWLWADGNIE